MAQDAKEVPSPVPQAGAGTVNIGKLVIEPFEHAIAAGLRHALKVGVPAYTVIEMMLNQLISVVAMVEPAGARTETLNHVQNAMTQLLSQHVQARQTSPGGVILPDRNLAGRAI